MLGGGAADSSILSNGTSDVETSSIQNRHTQQQILDSIQASLGANRGTQRLTDLLNRYRGDLINSEQLASLAQRREAQGRSLLQDRS